MRSPAPSAEPAGPEKEHHRDMTVTNPPTAPAPTPTERGRGTDVGLLIVVILAFTALILSFVAFASGDDEAETATGGGGSTAASASLTEFAIEPGDLTVAEGGSIQVTNDGTQVHNLAVVDQDLKT